MTEKLDRLMQERGINRSELSEQAEIPYMTIVNFYAKGTDNVKRSTMMKLSKFFGVSLDYLADDTVEAKAAPRLQAAAAHFDLDKLTDEGIERYNEYVQYLAERFSKE